KGGNIQFSYEESAFSVLFKKIYGIADITTRILITEIQLKCAYTKLRRNAKTLQASFHRLTNCRSKLSEAREILLNESIIGPAKPDLSHFQTVRFVRKKTCEDGRRLSVLSPNISDSETVKESISCFSHKSDIPHARTREQRKRQTMEAQGTQDSVPRNGVPA
ncbi:hypothetical protein WA026_006571, partial [Henosepilachna vigintioctopunctata]